MILNVVLQHKAEEIRTHDCAVDKIIELNGDDYSMLYQDLYSEYPYIKENSAWMRTDENNVSHCLLVLCEGMDDGILIYSAGYDYPRYSAFVPHARQIATAYNLPFSPNRLAQILDRALDWIGNIESGGELYNTLVEQLHMSDEEISAAGFDSLSDYFYDPEENFNMELK